MARPVKELEIDTDQGLTPDQAFAIVLRERRLELGLTQSDLEDDNNIDRSFILKFELAKREVGWKAIFHLARILQLTPGQLMDRVEDVLVNGAHGKEVPVGNPEKRANELWGEIFSRIVASYKGRMYNIVDVVRPVA